MHQWHASTSCSFHVHDTPHWSSLLELALDQVLYPSLNASTHSIQRRLTLRASCMSSVASASLMSGLCFSLNNGRANMLPKPASICHA